MPRTILEPRFHVEYLSILDSDGNLDAALEPKLAPGERRSLHRAMEGSELAGSELRLERGVEVAVAVENRQVFDVEPRLEDGSGHRRSGALILPLVDNQRVMRRFGFTGGGRW